MNTVAVVVFLVLLFVLLLVVMYKPSLPTVYGSMGCPHTVKLRDSIGSHNFVDCTSQKCPEFVEAYPTTQYPDGSIKVGA